MKVRCAAVLLVPLAACAPRPANPVPSASTAGPAASSSGPACAEPARHQLDFWLGDWDLVVRARGPAGAWAEARGLSVIRSVLGGCAVEENFHADGPDAPWAGRSFSTWVAPLGAWRQTWVDDSGSYLAFVGGVAGDDFVLYGEPRTSNGRVSRMRMVFHRQGADALGWSWERQAGEGEPFEPVMTIAYARRPAPASNLGCAGDPGFHELDFWLGDWRVVSAGKEVGRNHIEALLGGCAVLESWTGADGLEGKSLFFRPPGSATWKQVWVTASAAAVGGTKEKQLVARGEDGSLRFQGELPLPGGRLLLDRTTLTPQPDGRVHQKIEISRDDGAHFETTFDAHYERTGPPR